MSTPRELTSQGLHLRNLLAISELTRTATIPDRRWVAIRYNTDTHMLYVDNDDVTKYPTNTIGVCVADRYYSPAEIAKCVQTMLAYKFKQKCRCLYYCPKACEQACH